MTSSYLAKWMPAAILPSSGPVRCILRWISSGVIGLRSHTTDIRREIDNLGFIFEICRSLMFLVSGIVLCLTRSMASFTVIVILSSGARSPGILGGGVWVKGWAIGQILSSVVIRIRLGRRRGSNRRIRMRRQLRSVIESRPVTRNRGLVVFSRSIAKMPVVGSWVMKRFSILTECQVISLLETLRVSAPFIATARIPWRLGRRTKAPSVRSLTTKLITWSPGAASSSSTFRASVVIRTIGIRIHIFSSVVVVSALLVVLSALGVRRCFRPLRNGFT